MSTKKLLCVYFIADGWQYKCDIAHTPTTVPSSPSELMSTISFNKYQFPSYEDYKGAVTAIIRLQDTYQLPAHNLTQPEMAGVLPLR